MADVAPMLSVLGYDPYANPPNYGQPDSSVKYNTYRVILYTLRYDTNKFIFSYH